MDGCLKQIQDVKLIGGEQIAGGIIQVILVWDAIQQTDAGGILALEEADGVEI